MSAFFAILTARAKTIDSVLCVGLDPRAPLNELLDANRRIIEETAELALCFKPNIAFYEAHGPAGLELLERTIAEIPTETPIILDAKRGDIGATSRAYATAVRRLGPVSAVTVSPYMGWDSVQPFVEDAGLALFVLCRTSNPGAAEVQPDVYQRVAAAALSWPAEVGLVVAGNNAEALAQIRSAHPSCWMLAPGIGAQGGAMGDAVQSGIRDDGLGLIVNASRSVAQADSPKKAATELVSAFRAARDGGRVRRGRARGRSAATSGEGPGDGVTGDREAFFAGLLTTGCFRTGEFTLKSGIVSPFYLDLRRVQSAPSLLRLAARAYAEAAAGLEFDRVAGVPVAALPLAAAFSLEVGVPLIYPRLPPKPHGSGNRIEGAYESGERVLLLDDLITTGASKLEAAGVLREAGLVVEDLVVLVERGRVGRAEMRGAGINLHAYAQIEEVVAAGERTGGITSGAAQRVRAFLETS